MAKILVVDDDRELQENIVEVLAEAGFDVCAASNGEEALEQLATTAIDLVLLDSIMPGMNGMETLPQIKRAYPQAKIIMMTAFSTVDSAVEAMRKGADDFITKPFKIDEIIMAIRRSLEEAKFAACQEMLNMDDMFKCLANASRRKILFLIKKEGRQRFMDIARKLEIDDHTKMNFHLKVLKEANLLEQDGRKAYQLTPQATKIVACLNSISEA